MKKTLKALLIGTTALALLSAGCSVTTDEATEATEPAVVVTEAPAPVEAPAPTQAPVEAPADNPADVQDCSQIDVTVTSALVPEDWDEWCLGVIVGGQIYNSLSTTEATNLCNEFWATPDETILAIFMSPDGGSNTRDAAIGIIDSLWLSCSNALV